MRALILTGAGRYADPWHPYAATSDSLGFVLSSDFDVTIDDDIDGAMEKLSDVQLLVVNAGDPWRNEPSFRGAPAAAIRGLRAALERGIGLLAMHSSVSSLRDYEDWAPAIGGIWIPGSSFHPDADLTRIDTVKDSDEVPGLVNFDVFDERYCQLQRVGESLTLAWHQGDGRPEPAVWIRKYRRSRVAVDVLGHDARSYDSREHCELVRRLAQWAASA